VTAQAGAEKKKKAPGLYLIIGGKLIKGVVLFLLAMSVFSLKDKNLPDLFHRFLVFIHEDPEKLFFTEVAEKIREITPEGMRQVAWGSLIYSALVTSEGFGMMFRQSWAGWLSIGESVFFVPIEVRHLLHIFTWKVLAILVINVIIVLYLFLNRERLFKHHGRD
jgi:uncharacterized membrane protein (DUF2068 family)